MQIFNPFKWAKKSVSIETIVQRMASAGGSTAGVVVNEKTAFNVSAVSACVGLIASDVASLPFEVRRETGDATAPERGHPVDTILRRKPNSWQTPFEFRGMMTAHAVLRGNAYAFKVRTGDGITQELWPLQPKEVEPFIDSKGDIKYRIQAYEGRFSGEFSRDNLLHLRGLTWDGLKGMDKLATANDNIGLAGAAGKTQSLAFKNGSRLPGLLTTPESLSDEQMNKIAEGWAARSSGDNQWKTPLLDGGMDYKTVSNNAKDSQLIETRKHQIVEICAQFGVSPAVLGIDDKTQAFASVEAMMRWHLQHTLNPWLVCWAQCVDRDLLDGEGPLFAKFDTRELTKPTTKERAESYRALVELGIMTRNEARELEGLAPLAGLDEPLTPMNMNTTEETEGTPDEAGT